MPRIKKKLKLPKQSMIMHTKNPGHVCDVEWKIDNVLQFPEETFTTKVNLGRGCRTKLNLLVAIIEKENENYSNFYMGYERTDQQKKAVRVIFDLKLVNSKGDVYMQNKSSFSPKTDHKFRRILKIKFADPDYFERATKLTEDELSESDDDVLKTLVSNGLVVWDEESSTRLYSLPGDSITIKGCVKVFACCVPLRPKPINQSSPRGVSAETEKSELVKHLQSAFISEMDTGQFADFTVWIDGKSVHAHKFILAARSPKFKSLLEPDSDGVSINEMAITNMEMYDFQQFLHYLYTGMMGIMKWELLEKLYEAAIVFEVDSLKEECKSKMIAALRDKRASRALLFADKHKDGDLKRATIDFIKDIFFRYQNTNYWTSFRESHPGMANEVMKCVIDSI